MSDYIPSWPAVVKHATDRIEALRTALETAPADRIAGLQAEIKALRSVLALPAQLDPSTHIEPESSRY